MICLIFVFSLSSRPRYYGLGMYCVSYSDRLDLSARYLAIDQDLTCEH